MRRWPFVLVWLAIGAAVWNGFYDLYVSRGAREYLQFEAEAALGRRPMPSMVHVMEANQRDGATAATCWACLVIGAGLGTAYLCRRS